MKYYKTKCYEWEDPRMTPEIRKLIDDCPLEKFTREFYYKLLPPLEKYMSLKERSRISKKRKYFK